MWQRTINSATPFIDFLASITFSSLGTHAYLQIHARKRATPVFSARHGTAHYTITAVR